MILEAIFEKVGARNFIVLGLFLTTYINYTMRSNMSISLPAMVHLGKKSKIPDCKKDEVSHNQTVLPKDDTGTKYDWAQDVQGLILAAYFYGYMIGSLPAGMISEWIGPFKVIFVVTALSGIINSTCVWIIPIHWGVLFFCRLVIGFLGGLVYPALQTLIGQWSPPAERGKFVSALMGNTLGTCITWIVVGVVTKHYKWPWGFHVVSLQVIVFLLIFLLICSDSPETHKWITQKELNYIKQSQAGVVSSTKVVAPYKSILTSFPFWTLTILHFGNLWGLYVQITAVPKFMKEVIGFDIRSSGFLSSLPHLMRLIMGIIFGQVGDFLNRRKYRRIVILKSFILLSHIIPGILMGCMCLVGCNSTPALVLLVLSMAINGAAVLTSMANPIDLSPNFAGTIFGLVNFMGGVSGFIVPSITGEIVKTFGNTIKAWSIVFALGGMAYLSCGVFFIFFGSSDIQPWNEKREDSEEEPKPSNNTEINA